MHEKRTTLMDTTFSTHLLICCILTLFAFSACSTSKPEEAPPSREYLPGDQNEDGTYILVDRMPEMIGGLDSIKPYVYYPADLRGSGIEGRVFIQFVVTKRGYPENLEVVKGVHHKLDKIALNAVSKAVFVPAKHNDELVPVKMSIPITFRSGI